MRWKPNRPEPGAERWVDPFALTPVLREEGVWVWLACAVLLYEWVFGVVDKREEEQDE